MSARYSSVIFTGPPSVGHAARPAEDTRGEDPPPTPPAPPARSASNARNPQGASIRTRRALLESAAHVCGEALTEAFSDPARPRTNFPHATNFQGKTCRLVVIS